MALPKLNDTPKYNITIPSTGKKVKFRPYLVKEEKVLLIAMESKDTVAAIEAIVDTITSCIADNINPEKLTTFDVEYLFTQIRAKSSGETTNILMACSDCNVQNEVSIKLDDLKIKVPKVKTLYKLNDETSIELKYPSYSILTEYDMESENTAQKSFEMATSCIDSILYGEERIDSSDCSREELLEFLDSMTTDQFKIITSFVETMPRLSHNVKFKCESCDVDNDHLIEGMQSFF